jgi:hypothetical protein
MNKVDAAELLPLLPPLLLPPLLRCTACGNNCSCHNIQPRLLLVLLLLLPLLGDLCCSLRQLTHSKGKPATKMLQKALISARSRRLVRVTVCCCCVEQMQLYFLCFMPFWLTAAPAKLCAPVESKCCKH